MKVELLQITPSAEIFIARCARISRAKTDNLPIEEARALIRKLIKLGHESVLEHAVASFYIEGISRVCLAQLTRHRIASFTVESHRYAKPKREAILPPTITRSDDQSLKKMIEILIDNAFLVYENLIASGIPKEDARFFLPQAIPTSLIMTANFREWRHILKLRTGKDAQWEIRSLSLEILKILHQHAPSVFEDILEKVQSD